MNRGAGLHITTGAGSINTAIGPGRHVVNFTSDAVGGGRRWLRSCSIFRLAIRSVGTRLIITTAIHARETTTGIGTATGTGATIVIAIGTVAGAA